jgi:hypothetical protein
VTTILTGLGVGTASMFSSLDEMVDLTNIGTLFAFILVCVGIVILRIKDPDRKRPFRAPFGLVFPVLGALCCLGLIYYLPPTSWLRFAAWLNIGFVIYVCYGSTHSRLTGRHTAIDEGRHTVQVAHAGAWLALGGTGALFATRAADALRQHAAFTDWFFSNSWWMTVPLLLNAFLLCPTALGRLQRMDRSGFDGHAFRRARLAGALYSVLLLATLSYLGLIALR